ncbi:GTPase [Massilia sp. Root351]|jgi:hypothetical protein|uniref:hypothetical protein n=1 Tax=Massilia sp. Root351 TaxID=1736522 RepID=UPI00070CC9C0|nr:hypothetical protein [Massilia sp. Root351]KQV88565.1 GTPase [Massilia sp. Root351]
MAGAAGGAPPTRTTLVTGARAAVREAAIAAALAHAGTPPSPLPSAAVILEGLADANSPLVHAPETGLQVLRIAPGCLCCAGNLVLRVTLNRLLRRPPAQLFISLANAEHVDQLRSMLLAAPYGDLLDLAADLQA